MKSFTLLFFSILLLKFGFVNAQITDFSSSDEPYIEMIGTAELNIEPDEIFIQIDLIENSDYSIETQEQNLIKAIQLLGINSKNLVLSDATADLERSFFGGKDVVNRKKYVLKVGSATLVTKVYTELAKLKIRNASIFKVSHSKMDSLRKVVYIMAVKAAKAKADYMLEAIGEKTGKALVIREELFYDLNILSGNSFYCTTNSKYKSESQENYDLDIDYKSINIKISVYTKFRIQ